jgi:hypothetical protein
VPDRYTYLDIRLCPGAVGLGISSDHVVAQAFAYTNLKRKCFVL